MKQVEDFLIEHQIRPSSPRCRIYQYLTELRNHPTAEQIYQELLPELPGLSKTTVYNTLRLFLQQGVAVSLNIDDNESRFDACTVFHAHFRCKRCGAIYDIPMPGEDLLFENLEDYDIIEKQLYLKGYCPQCKTL